MSVRSLEKFETGAPRRLSRVNLARPPIAPREADAPLEDPHAALFRSACAQFAAQSVATEEALRAEAAEIVARIIRAIAPALLETGARESVSALLQSFSDGGAGELAIAANAADIPTLERHAAPGVTFESDETIAAGDFRARWPDGGMTRDATALIEGLLAALERASKEESNGAEHRG